MSTTRVLIISHDVVDERMAGPGIRYWELARVLAAQCAVTLAVPGRTALQGSGFKVKTYQLDDWITVRPLAEQADVIMPCGFVIHHFPQLAEIGCPIVIDLYDPHPVENLILISGLPAAEQEAQQRELLERLRRECLAGDFYLAASEHQRDWWLGLLTAHGRLNTASLGADPTLRKLIDVVPFGCRPEPLAATRRVIKGVLPGVQLEDRVLLWGGGIWEWLDPLTLLHALPRVLNERRDVKAVFPGTRHPNQSVADMPMRHRAVELARDLGLLGEHVFFGEWVPYADWPDYLLEADIGISLHLDSVETHLAFRSRVLDYVRAELPMIVSAGEATSALVTRYDLGIVVPVGGVSDVAEAVLCVLEEPREARRERFVQARADLAWERMAEPLVAFCLAPYRAADREAGAIPDLEGASTATRQLAYLREEQEKQRIELESLRKLVQAYEQGRFIRFMRALQGLRRG